MARYAEYKDSGVDWIGTIPVGWDLKRVQDLATYNDDVVDEITHKKREIKYVDISSVNAVTNTYSFEDMLFDNAPSRAKRTTKSGDTIFSTVRPYLKAVATLHNPEPNLVVSTGFAVARPKKKTNANFLGYLLRNETFINEVSANSVGASYPAINASDLFKIKTPFPDINTQAAIANFLDGKVAKIEALVEIKRRQIELLAERKQILIQNAVSKGLNPDAPMKYSGVDWIGTIPAHWEMKRVKNIFQLIVDPSGRNNCYELLSIYTDIGVRPRKDLKEKGNKASTTDGYWIVKKGDFIVNKLLAWMGAVGVSEYEGVTSPAYDILRACRPISGNFYHYLFRSKVFSTVMKRHSKGIMDMRLRLYFDKFGVIEVPYPNHTEQQEISEFIDREANKIDDAVIIKQNQITKLNEYKATLINAAVTGKIKVT